MKTALIGYTGFIGGNIAKQYRFTDYYNSSNIVKIHHKKYDLVVSAGTYAERWKANQNPKRDWQNIKKLVDNLKTVKANRFVLISTVDVYPVPQKVNEDTKVKLADLKQPYGINRLKMEASIKKIFPNVTILRLPQTFGEGLRKNFVYDLIHDNALDFTHKDSLLQFYNLSNIWRDIQKAIKQNVSVMNLAVEPVTTRELAKYCLGINFKTITKSPPLNYTMTSIYGKPYLYTKKQILKELKNFIQKERSKTKIAISNLAWDKKDKENIIPLMKRYQIAGIEIAPSKIWDNPTTIQKSEATKYLKLWQGSGIKIVAVTSLLYGHPELTIFENNEKRTKTLNYLIKMIRLASWLGAKVVVFGSPKNRLIGKMSNKEAEKVAIVFFKKLGRETRKYSTDVCLEPIPKIYGADYLTSTDEVFSLVKKISHPNIKINLDSGAMKINNENFEKTIKKTFPLIGHLHISEKNFVKIGNNKFGHSLISKTLKKLKYDRWASIEMWSKEGQDNLENINKALKYVINIYR